MTAGRLLRCLYAGPVGDAPAVANPYRDEIATLDRPGASARRRRNLEAYLEAVGRVRLLLVGEALGYRGGRFSGIAFTSERQLAGPPAVRLPWAHEALKATSRHPALWSEPSGTIVWRALGGRAEGVLLWNAFPWHPYRRGGRRAGEGDPRLANRTPEASLVRRHLSVLDHVLGWAQPERVAAVGKVATGALRNLEIEARSLRHPARGGARLFAAQLGDLLAETAFDQGGRPAGSPGGKAC